jgi:quinol monooxygenase YgiN
VIVVAGTVRLPPENLPAARPHMRAMVEASRAEAGCLQYAYAEDMFEPGLIHVSEQWRDREALKTHFKTAHMAAWRAAWPSLGFTERNLIRIDGGDVQPL